MALFQQRKQLNAGKKGGKKGATESSSAGSETSQTGSGDAAAPAMAGLSVEGT